MNQIYTAKGPVEWVDTRDKDVSKTWQPDGAVDTNVPVRPKVEAPTEQQILEEVDRYLHDLNSARKDFDARYGRELEQDRVIRESWLSERPDVSSANYSKWLKADPGLSSSPEVIKARSRVNTLRAALAKAEAELNEVETAGTEFTRYVETVIRLQAIPNNLLRIMRDVRTKERLVELVGTADDPKPQMKLIAQEHVDVRLFGDVVIPTLDATNRFPGIEKVKLTETIVRRELNRLRDNIASTSKG
jgi:hypothetical protein